MDVSRGMLVFFFSLKQETNVRVKFELGFVLVKSDLSLTYLENI